jgi:hypothetical protein
MQTDLYIVAAHSEAQPVAGRSHVHQTGAVDETHREAKSQLPLVPQGPQIFNVTLRLLRQVCHLETEIESLAVYR